MSTDTHHPIVQKYRHCFLSCSRSPQPAAFADRKRLVASRTGSDGKAAPASIDQGARIGGASQQELLTGPLPLDYVRMVSSREFVPHHPEHRDKGVSATCSALSHCLLPLCCVARTPRTPHAALALLLLVPRTHQTPRTNDDARRRKDAACPHGHKAGDTDRWGK